MGAEWWRATPTGCGSVQWQLAVSQSEHDCIKYFLLLIFSNSATAVSESFRRTTEVMTNTSRYSHWNRRLRETCQANVKFSFKYSNSPVCRESEQVKATKTVIKGWLGKDLKMSTEKWYQSTVAYTKNVLLMTCSTTVDQSTNWTTRQTKEQKFTWEKPETNDRRNRQQCTMQTCNVWHWLDFSF